MNYAKHYHALISRAKSSIREGYTEKHHIQPKCLGGNDDVENIVCLTPEEHYVAHQLLVKMYPNEPKLLHAARMMTVGEKRNNKMYGWLRKKYITECRKRVGDNNPSFGKSWYHDPETLQSGKFDKNDIPQGWIRGRVMRPESKTPNILKCMCCNNYFEHQSQKKKFCSVLCRAIQNKKDREQKSREKAYATWNSYINGEYTSVLEFFRQDDTYNTHQHMYRDWKKYVPEYKSSGPDGKGMDCKSKAS